MAKRGRPKKEPATVTRINAHKPNGAESKVIAPEENPPAVELGAVVLPSGEDAVKALAVLAELNDRQLQAHAAYLESKTRTQQRKAKWEELATELQTKIRRFTHASDLPLFDTEEREADQARMEGAGEWAPHALGLAPVNEVPQEGAEAPQTNQDASGTF